MSKILIDEAVRDAAYKEYYQQRAVAIAKDAEERRQWAIRDGSTDTAGTAWGALLKAVEGDFLDEKRLWDAAWDAALRQALADAALDKMADNARELGLSYEQPCKYGNEPASCTSSPMDCQCAIDAALEQPAPAQPAPAQPLTDEVRVPLEVLEAAESSLGSFCSDEGWSDQDMQNMDNLSAYIARHKAAHGITKGNT